MKKWFKTGEIKLKNSRFFSYRKSAKKIFYPGCSLPGADPDFSLKLYRKLQKKEPGLGIWFDCCAKPLRMTRANEAAETMEQDLLQSMLAAGVEEVYTACGNCFQQFKGFAATRLKIHMVYDLLDELDPVPASTDWTIHHPCFARSEPQLQQGVLRLADQHGFEINNRQQKDHPLPCCLHTNTRAQERRRKLQQGKLLTYCAHCVMSFQQDIPTRHLLQELLGSSAVWKKLTTAGLFLNYRRFCQHLKKESQEGSLLTKTASSKTSPSLR